MTVMSNDVNIRSESMGISCRSVTKWAEFRTLNVYGRGMNASSFLTSSLTILYAWAFVRLAISLMGDPSLCNFIRPVMG
jgi:hypothetical protein